MRLKSNPGGFIRFGEYLNNRHLLPLMTQDSIRAYLAAIGRKGGRSKSPRKAAQSREPLPSVAGHMSMTHADFQNACLVALQDLERVPVPGPDRVITQLLCEAVRCSRECLATVAKLTEQQHNAFPKGRW